MKVLRLADGRHVARWHDPLSGKAQQQSLDVLGLTSDATRRKWASTKSEALGELRRAMSTGAVTSERHGVREAVADYLAQHANEGTKANKRIVLDEFVAWCDAHRIRTLADIKAPSLMRWRDHLLSAKRCSHASSTRNRWLIAGGIFLRWASKRGLLPLVGWDSIRHACERAPEPVEAIEFLRPPDLRRLLQACVDHDATSHAHWKVAPFVLALLLTGCRFEEVAALRWEEVDLDAGAIRLPAARTKTKRAREITFRETPTLAVLLARLRPENATGDVFDVPRHSTWESARRRLIARYGAPAAFTAHALRRSCGTILTNAAGIYGGASAWHSAKRLGHSVAMAESAYAGQLTGLPPAAETLEAAAGIADLCQRIARGE